MSFNGRPQWPRYVPGCLALSWPAMGSHSQLHARIKSTRILRVKKYGAAAHQIEKYLRSCPQSSVVYQKLGFAYYYSGQSDKASEVLHRATQFRTAELHVSISQGYHFAGNHARETEEARKR